MEPDAPTPPTAAVELRALGRLRERIEAAAREVERLRAENAALAGRLAEMHDGPPPAGLVLPDEESPEALRARIEGFIETLDRLLAGDLPPADLVADDLDPPVSDPP